MKKDSNTIELRPLVIKHARIYIEGDGDLCLNKMNARSTRILLSDDRKAIQPPPNKWEDIITAIHWRDPLPEDTYNICDEALLNKLSKENAPCISAFGLRKSFGQAVVRNEIDKYATKFDNAVNITAPRNLVPITFDKWTIDERLMSPKRGAPVTVRLNIFSGWKAEFQIDYTEHVYSLEQILNIINYAGFGLGIGSGRTSGYGRYHIIKVS